jgi:hypothetical protein
VILSDDERYAQVDSHNYTHLERDFRHQIAAYFDTASGTVLDKLNSFSKFVPRQALSLFLAKYYIYQLSMAAHGSIVECGVFTGSGLFTFSQLVSVHEPYNHNRRVIGFDSFAGFPSISEQDGPAAGYKHISGLAFTLEQELKEAARLHDANRPLGHIPRIELVKGDAMVTIPAYVQENAHLMVSLLYLDFDLYEPTKIALQTFLPRMPKGAVIAFDELSQKQWPGETQAVMETCGISTLRIQRLPYTPSLSFAVIGD